MCTTRFKLKLEGHDGPESLDRVIFSTKEFYIFVPLVPTCDPRGGASFDPKGYHMNKIDKSLQGDATYQKSKIHPFKFQRRRILKLVFVPMFQLVTLLWINKIDKGPQRDAKYQISKL